jgi:NitT/TauT family transport system permease protein
VSRVDAASAVGWESVAVTPTSSPVPGGSPGTRGRRQHPLARIRSPISVRSRIVLGISGVACIFIPWFVFSSVMHSNSVIIPTPGATWDALVALARDGTLATDMYASCKRIFVGYSISMAIGVVLGLTMGTFASAEAFFEPQFGFLRYIPASALTPVFLLWFGLGESPKIYLIVVGTVFFNVLMVADVARTVPRELLNASYTLGASRWTVMRRVVFRHSVPGMIDVARINLAAAWLMLVVSEVLAADSGLAYRILRAQRFRAVDTMFALLIVMGIIGMVSDLGLRALRHFAAPWARP